MQLHNYFANTPPAKWNINTFRTFLNRAPAVSSSSSSTPAAADVPRPFSDAKRLFADQLSHMLARRTPYQCSPREWRTAALRLKDAAKAGRKTRTHATRQARAEAAAATTVFSTSVTSSGDAPFIIGTSPNVSTAGPATSTTTITTNTTPTPNVRSERSPPPRAAAATSPSPTPSSSPCRQASDTSDSGDTRLLAGHALTMGELLATLRHAAPSVANLKLAREVAQGVVFARHVAPFLPAKLRPAVRRVLPRLEPVSAGVQRCLDVADAGADAASLATATATEAAAAADVDDDTAVAIAHDAAFFRRKLAHLATLAPHAGETWLAVNVWGRLLDSIFLESRTLFINRSELVPHACPNLKCDGLILPVAPPLQLARFGVRQLELGFVEVKRARASSAAGGGWEADERKLLALMRAALVALTAIWPGAAQAHEDEEPVIVVVGVLCVGFDIRVYRARSTAAGAVCFFGEDWARLEPGYVGAVMRLAWQVKATVEKSYRTILAGLGNSASEREEEEEAEEREDGEEEDEDEED